MDTLHIDKPRTEIKRPLAKILSEVAVKYRVSITEIQTHGKRPAKKSELDRCIAILCVLARREFYYRALTETNCKARVIANFVGRPAHGVPIAARKFARLNSLTDPYEHFLRDIPTEIVCPACGAVETNSRRSCREKLIRELRTYSQWEWVQVENGREFRCWECV